MVGSTQLATNSSSDYTSLALTTVKLWGTYRTPTIIACVSLLVLTIILFIRKGSWVKWLTLFLTIITGLSILGFDQLTDYVAQKRKTAVRDTLLAPVNKVGGLIKGIFGFGK